MDSSAVRVIRRIARRARLRRVTTDLEKCCAILTVIRGVVVLLVAQLVEVPAELAPIDVVVEDALVLFVAVLGWLRNACRDIREEYRSAGNAGWSRGAHCGKSLSLLVGKEQPGRKQSVISSLPLNNAQRC